MNCEFSELTTSWLAIGLLLAAASFAWLMRIVKRRLREGHPALWRDLDDTALRVHKRLGNSARLFIFILLGRYTHLGDNDLNRAAIGARMLLLVFVVGGLLVGYCQ